MKNEHQISLKKLQEFKDSKMQQSEIIELYKK